ncbi:MAG: efflux RND transporter periplasmic adaptor subunit [Proteobacteria bacterium]|nr:efflux RND transporter periplasmic adaptor subunit [Pseudomonadota bacterium]
MLQTFILFLFFVAGVKADAPPPQAVVLTTVKEGCLSECLAGVGTFTPYNDVTLKAEIAGRIEIVHFKEGDSVKENQKLFSLYAKEQTAKVKKAEATLKLSKSTLARKQKLIEKKFVSPQDLEKTEAEVKAHEAELELAKEDLAKTQIISPFEGVLSVKKVCKGAYVAVGDELVRIQDLDPIRLTFQLPQKDIPMIKVGDSITATTDVYPDKHFEGKIEAIDPSVNEKTRSFTVYATFPNKEKLLIPGLYGQVKPNSSTKKASSLLVPEQALVIRQDGAHIFKKVADKAVLTKITLGVRTADQAEVLTGLQKGDEIVLEGQDKIHDGDVIAGVQGQ